MTDRFSNTVEQTVWVLWYILVSGICAYFAHAKWKELKKWDANEGR